MNEIIGIALIIFMFGMLFYYIHTQTKLADEITKGLEKK